MSRDDQITELYHSLMRVRPPKGLDEAAIVEAYLRALAVTAGIPTTKEVLDVLRRELAQHRME
jgi:hypothetical protein